MPNNYMKKCSNSLAIRCELKQEDIHLHPTDGQ